MANSYIDYVGNGSLTTFTSPPYLEKAHLIVTVGGNIKALSTDYSVADGSTIVVFNTAPEANIKIRISRSSSQNERLTDYVNASLLTADQMDKDANQLFYMAQEAVDVAERTDFGAQTFYSSGTTDPSTANAGDLFFNSQTGLLKIYNGSAWESVNNRGHKQTFAISGSTTVFTPSNPVDVNTLVFLNGVLLVEGAGSTGDYTTSSTQVTLNVAVTSGVVEIVSFPNAAFVGTVNAVDGNFSGNITCDDIICDGLTADYIDLTGGETTTTTGTIACKMIVLNDSSNDLSDGSTIFTEANSVDSNNSSLIIQQSDNVADYIKLRLGSGGAGTLVDVLTASTTGIDVTGDVAANSLTIDNGTSFTGATINSATGASVLTVKSTFEGGTEWQNVGVIEVGGHDKAYVDLKKPDTDDTDLRLLHDGDGSLTAFTGDLLLQTSSSNSSGKVALVNGVNTRLETTSTGINVTGTVTADGLTLGAGEIATFNSGAGGDLQISGDATGSFSLIKQTGGGDLFIQGQNGFLRNDAGNALVAWDGDHSELCWQGSTGAGIKLATTEVGIDVTGKVECKDTVAITTTGSGGDPAPDLDFINLHAYAIDERLGQINYYGMNNGSAQTKYAWTEVRTIDVTEDAEKAQHETWVKNGASHSRVLAVQPTGISVTGTVTPSGGYKSSDGTAGYTGSASASATLTIKNGLIVAVS